MQIKNFISGCNLNNKNKNDAIFDIAIFRARGFPDLPFNLFFLKEIKARVEEEKQNIKLCNNKILNLSFLQV